MQAQKLQIKARYAKDSALFPKEMKEADELYDGTLARLKDALLNDKTGVLAQESIRLKALMDGEKLDLAQNSAQVRGLAAARELLGDKIASDVTVKNMQSAINHVDALFRERVIADVVTGNAKSAAAAFKRGDKPEGFDATKTKEVVDQFVHIIEHPETLREGRASTLRAWFNPDNKEMWDAMFVDGKLSTADKIGYLKKFTGARAAQSIKETGDLDLIS